MRTFLQPTTRKILLTIYFAVWISLIWSTLFSNAFWFDVGCKPQPSGMLMCTFDYYITLKSFLFRLPLFLPLYLFSALLSFYKKYFWYSLFFITLILVIIFSVAFYSIHTRRVTEVATKTSTSSAKPDETANEKIIYSYGYRPVNPKYVQVTTIIVEKGKVTKTVADGSGNIKSNNYYKISSSQFNGIVEGIKKYNISSKETDVNKGCTGGSTRTLQILENDDEEVLHGEVYSCGGKDFTNISGGYEKIFAEIENLIP
jgi:hypothetical protein